MYHDLLVATTGRGDDAAAISTACALVAPDDGHVAVLVQVHVPLPAPDASGMGLIPTEALVTLREQIHREGEAHCQRWREALQGHGTKGEVRLVDDLLASRAQNAAMQARYADLSVIGLSDPGALPVEIHDQAAKLLSGSGRPLMIVPKGHRPARCARIMIGWRPSASAARAVHDAMPLMKRADAIDIVCVDPRRGQGDHGEDPGVDIARHLARHGLKVSVHVAHGAGDEPGAVLLQRARETGADLLVMGGYSRSRLIEWMLGGTTRHILTSATLPVLLAH